MLTKTHQLSCAPRSNMDDDVIMAETIAYHKIMRDKYQASLTHMRDVWHTLRRELETETDPLIRQ